jgi:hypothetical protein
VDVSRRAAEYGFRVPVSIADEVWNEYVEPSPVAVPWGESREERLGKILRRLRWMEWTREGRVTFRVVLVMGERCRRGIELHAVYYRQTRNDSIAVAVVKPATRPTEVTSG